MLMKNKKGDITNFLRKKVVIKEVPFATKGKPKSEYLLFTNKKADIAITILVIAVVVLCAAALFSFYAIGDRDSAKKVVNSFYYLQEVYNLVESVEYSGVELESSYEKDCDCEIESGVVKKDFLDGKLKIEYDFNKK